MTPSASSCIGDSNTIINSGTITVGNGFAIGIDVTSFGGSNSIINTGTINVGAGGNRHSR